MKEIHIMEAVSENIHSKIFDEWKHEGFIGCWNSEYINFEISSDPDVICAIYSGCSVTRSEFSFVKALRIRSAWFISSQKTITLE